MSIEQLVRDTLVSYADRAGPPPDELDRTVLARHRRSRRQRAAIVSASVCAVLAILAVPVAMSTGHAPDAPGFAQGGAGGIFDLPTRGSLADDAQFVEAVRRLPWKDRLGRTPLPPDLVEPALDTRRVVFAGEVPGGRWVMVVGTVNDELLAAWFTGSSGAEATELVVQDAPHGIDPNHPVAFTKAGTAEQAMVVIGAPGDVIEVSDRGVLAESGAVSRDYRRVQAVDGVAVVNVSLLPPFTQTAMSVRVTRDTDEVFRGRPDISGSPQDAPPPELVQVRPGATEPELQAARATLSVLTEPFGLGPDEADAALLWAGDLPSPGRSPASAIVVALTVPSGVIAVAVDWNVPIDDQGTRAGSRCLQEAYPGGVAAADLLIAARCDITVLTDAADQDSVSSLIIVGPVNAVEAKLLGADGSDLGTIPLVDGVGAPGFVDGSTTVLALDGDGRVIAEAAVSTYEGGDWGNYGSGPTR